MSLSTLRKTILGAAVVIGSFALGAFWRQLAFEESAASTINSEAVDRAREAKRLVFAIALLDAGDFVSLRTLLRERLKYSNSLLKKLVPYVDPSDADAVQEAITAADNALETRSEEKLE